MADYVPIDWGRMDRLTSTPLLPPVDGKCRECKRQRPIFQVRRKGQHPWKLAPICAECAALSDASNRWSPVGLWSVAEASTVS